MNKVNYQKELDKIIASIGDTAPTLLLHSCCAPCSSYVIEYLSQYFNITVYYYNPNLYPDNEYEHRSKEQQRLISSMPTKNPVCYVDECFDSKPYYDCIRGLEQEPEGGKRCEKCFFLRLERTAKKAQELDFDYFATTLTISPLKNAQLINEIGQNLSREYGIPWLPSDFKKKEGYKRSIELSKEYNLYRQNYCGCVFSRSNIL
ncbi:MAG: epoxyqueuosine reductase QueH [Lachnospiraceae bacterium]|nr:epoxyqueuosine reductase QueH [Lachnospiraceae bacterium]